MDHCYSARQVFFRLFPRDSNDITFNKLCPTDLPLCHYFTCEYFTNTLFFSLLADTRTNDTTSLGNALIQHQQVGVLPTSTSIPVPLPLSDPLTSTSMPESWVRGAILVRMNSLIRGHSGIRWELIEKIGTLLEENIIPLVPLRGSISASGGQCLFIFLCIAAVNFFHPIQTFLRCHTLRVLSKVSLQSVSSTALVNSELAISSPRKTL